MSSSYFPDFGFEDDYEDETEEERIRRKHLDSIQNLYSLGENDSNDNEDLSTGNVDDLYREYRSEATPSSSPTDNSQFEELYSKPTGARELYQEYLSRRPDYEKDGPGFFELFFAPSNMIGMEYKEKVKKWQDEGNFVDNIARTLDADRAREIRAVERGMDLKKSEAIQDRLRENADLNRELRRDSADLAREDRIAQNLTRDEDRDEDRDIRRETLESSAESRDLARSDRLAARAESRADRATAKADRDKPTPSEQKSANDLVDQHIYRTQPELFEFEDENGKVYPKPKFIGDQVDATNLMAIRRNLLKRVLAGEVL